MNNVSLLAGIAPFKMNSLKNQCAISRFCESFGRAAIMKITKSPHEISHIDKTDLKLVPLIIVDNRLITKYLPEKKLNITRGTNPRRSARQGDQNDWMIDISDAKKHGVATWAANRAHLWFF